MKLLRDLLYGIRLETVVGSTAVPIESVSFDSRQVARDGLYIAITGTCSNGHDFIDDAISRGAKAVVLEHMPAQLSEGVTYVLTPCTREALALVAANLYNRPSEQVQVIGVTGTNGKTTVATLLYQLFSELGYASGLLSTIAVYVKDERYLASHTTPDPLQIQQYLAMMRDSGVTYCFMEVSSHGIDQKRTLGINFCGALFTNLSHDHLDYHGNFLAYRNVKKSWFDTLDKDAFALSNADDKNGSVMLQNTKAKTGYYSLTSIADYRASVVEMRFDGMLLRIANREFWTQLTGTFNAYNLVLVYATALELGEDPFQVVAAMSKLTPTPGRLNWIKGTQNRYGIVDFAHTPDALQNVLDAINALRTHNEQLITVLGCGGDRDPLKRPKMGSIAASFSTKVIITSDNPRSEDPQKIADQMLAGVGAQLRSRVFVQLDRAEAIRMAVALSGPGDLILVAGKGHESEQIIGDKRIPFSDTDHLSNALNL